MNYAHVVGIALIALSAHAHADTFHVTPLGQTVPMWYEHAAGVNDVETVAWTHMVGRTPRAAAWKNGSVYDLDASLSQPHARSYALDIDAHGDIVGYAASNERETA